MNALIALLTALIAFLLLFLLLRRKQSDREALRQRMAKLQTGEHPGDRTSQPDNAALSLGMAIVKFTARQLRKIHNSADLDFRMQQADWPLLGSEFLVISFSFGLFLGLILFLLTFQPLNLFLGVIAGLLTGTFCLNRRIKLRRKKFVHQLGDSLMIVANALRAGFSFLQAMELTAREMDAPLGTEFQKLINEMNVGSTLETALGNMSRRMESSDFDLVATAVLIQRQVGGDLSQILDTISETIRERVRMKAEILTLTAQGRFSGMILLSLPFLLCGFIMVFNPGYLRPMVNSPLGRLALAAGVVSELIGYFIIRRIVDIDTA